MKKRIFALFAKAALMAACLIGTPAFALNILPDSGRWVNLDEPGRNFNIEIQDNQFTLVTQLYEDGVATWFFTQGTLIGSDYYEGSLDRYVGGQCMTCTWTGPSSAGSVGSVQLLFTSPQTAILSWPGGTLDLVHRDSAIWLGTVYAALGEWAVVAGYESEGYFWGERIIFDWVANDGVEDYLWGYRTGDFDASEIDLYYDPSDDSYYGTFYDIDDGWDVDYWFSFYGQQSIRGWQIYYDTEGEYWYPFVGFRMKSGALVEMGSGPGMEESWDLDGYPE